MKKERSSNIELLRIFAMMLIVAFHYVYKGGFYFETATVNKHITNIVTMFGELGVNIFVLITGYFMIHGTFRWKKVIYLMIQVQFYNILTLIIANRNSLPNIFQNIEFRDYFPNIYGIYWFAVCYILLYIMSPYLNRLLKGLTKKEYQKFLLICLVLWCLIPTFFGMKLNETESLLYYNRFIWMMVVYAIGAYISLYGNSDRIFSYKASTYLTGAFLMLIFVSVLVVWMETNIHSLAWLGIFHATYFWRPNTIITLVWSILIFLGFLKLRVPSCNLINRVASTTLGIYLLHDERLVDFWWKEVFRNASHADSRFLLVHIGIAVVVIMAVGAVIDLVRQFIGKYCDKFVQRLIDNVFYKGKNVV